MKRLIVCLLAVFFICVFVGVSPVVADYTTAYADNGKSSTIDEALTVYIYEDLSTYNEYIKSLYYWYDENCYDWDVDAFVADQNSFYPTITDINAELGEKIKEGYSKDEVISYLTSQSDRFPTVILAKSSTLNNRPYTIFGSNDVLDGAGAINSTPVIANGKAYVLTSSTERTDLTDDRTGVYCIDLASELRDWYAPLDGTGGISGLTLRDGKLYLGTISGKLYCLDETCGKVLWRSDVIDTTPETGLSSTPLVLDGAVYVTAGTPVSLWAFSAEDGTLLYNTTVTTVEETGGSAVLSSPSTDGKYVFTSSTQGISAFDPVSTTILWTLKLTGTSGTPVYHNGTVFVETADALYAVSADTGESKWNVSHCGFATSPAVKDGIVIVNGQTGLTAYAEANGTRLWTHTTEAEVSHNSPVIAGDKVYYTANNVLDYLSYGSTAFSYIYGLNLVDGKESFVNAIDGGLFNPYSGNVIGGFISTSSPAVSNNLLFVGTGSSNVGSVDRATYADSLIGFGNPGKFTIMLYNGETTVPPHLTTVVNGETVLFTSALGLLAQTAGTTPLTIENGMLTAYGDKENTETAVWRMNINGNPQTDITTEIQDGDIILFYYGETEKTGDADYALRIEADITDTFAEISINPDYKRAFTVAETQPQTLNAVITDWEGNVISPAAGELKWTASSNAFTLLPEGCTLTYTPTGTVGDTSIFTLTYTPVNGDGASVSALTEPLSIYERQSPISSDPAIETTQTYFTWKGNYARTGVVNGTGPSTDNILWDVELPVIHKSGSTYVSLVDGSPVVYDGRVYVSAWDGGMSPDGLKVGVLCFDAKTGEEIWNNPALQSRAGMTIADDKLYVSGGNCLACIGLDDGRLIWKTPDISLYPYVGLTSTPIVYNGVAYVNTMTLSGNEIINCLYGFDAETGEQIVKIDGQAPDGYSGGAGMFSSPSMSPDGVLYVPGAGGVYAVDTATNAKLWEFDAGARSTAKQGSVTILGGNNMYVGSPVYKDQCVYFIRGGTVDEPTYFYCIDAITGEEISKYEIYSSPITPVITDDKLITLGAILSDSSSMGGATAYNLTTGEMLWHYDTGASSRASPIVAGDTVYFGTYKDGILYAVDINTGEEVWHSKFASASGATPGWWNIIEGTPAIENGTLYIGAENGHFYAFKTPTLEDIGITAPANITAGIPAIFNGISPLDGTTYAWNFGDKTVGTGKTISKTWDTAGTYTVKLTAQSEGQSGSAEITVIVEQPPKQITEPVPAEIITPVGVTDEEKPAVTFDVGDKNETAGNITITISDYQSDADGAINLGSITAPPDTDKLVVLLNLSVEGLKDQHKLNSYATLTVNISITDEDKTNLTFWRYADSLADGHLPELLKHTENTSLDAVDGWARFDIQVPGFSTIVGSIDSGQMSFAVIDPTGGIVTPTPTFLPSLNYISVNPGTGSFKYTTNHPDWPAVTFTINRMTAFGVLYASGANIVTAERWGGVYVDSINGLSPSTDTEGWMYQVNGCSPGVMANNYPVSIGDEVVWYYSEDMTKSVSQSKAVYAFIVGGTPLKPIIKNTGAVILPPDEFFIEETASIPAETGLVTLKRTNILTEVQVPVKALKNITDASLQVVEGNRVDLTLPVNISATDVFSILELSVLDGDQKEIEVNESGNFTFKCTVPSGKQLLVGHLNKTDVWENCTVIQTGDELWTAEYDALSTFAIFVIDEGKEIPLVDKAKSESILEPTVEPTVNTTTIGTPVPTTPLPTFTRATTPTAQSPAPIAGVILGILGTVVLFKRRT